MSKDGDARAIARALYPDQSEKALDVSASKIRRGTAGRYPRLIVALARNLATRKRSAAEVIRQTLEEIDKEPRS